MKILVTKVNSLGDTVSFLPTLSGVERALPSAEVTFLCSTVGWQAVRGSLPRVKVVTVEPDSTRGRRAVGPALWRALHELRKRRFDVSLHSYDEPSFSYLVSSALRVRRRVGFDGAIARSQILLTERIPLARSKNVVDIDFDLVRRLSGRQDLSPQRVPLAYGSAEQERMTRSLARCGVDPGAAFIALHAGARLAYKQWGVERFLQLAGRIERRLGMPAVIVNERSETLSEWKRLVHTPTVPDLACLLDQAWMFVGNNSGPMHVATAMGTPSVVVQGPSPKNWEIFWRDVCHTTVQADGIECKPCETLDRVPGRCLNEKRPKECLTAISTVQVESAVEELACSVGRGERREPT